jgi:hypothetical protein
MEIRTKFAIGQSVVTNEGQKGEVSRIVVELTTLGQVSLAYMVETDDGEDEYLENELYTESELTGEQGEHVINTRFSLGQKVYCVFGNDVDYGTIKEIICSYEQESPEMMYTLGLNYHVTFVDGDTDWGVFTEDEKDKLVNYITNKIDN